MFEIMEQGRRVWTEPVLQARIGEIGLGLFLTWDFFLKRTDPLKILRNKLNMKNIGTKSINMSGIMVYLAMFSTTIDTIICFWVLIR